MATRAKVSKKLREKLLNQKSNMSSGVLIDNKKFTKGRFRILPAGGDEVPGREFVSIYCASVEGDKKSTTSPAAFGLPCPVLDAQERIKMTGDKEDKQFAWDFMNVQREYWMPVVDRAMEGDASKPVIRVFRAKRRIYEQIIDYMIDEDDGEDITHPKTGRDIRVRRKGSGKDTEWTLKFLDADLLSEDEDYTEAVLALNAAFNIEGYFYGVDWEVLEEIYKGLTGEDEIPAEYDEVKDQLAVKKPDEDAADEDADEDGEGDAEGEDDAADEDADEDGEGDAEGEDDAAEEGSDELTVGTTVEFKDDDGEVQQGELVDITEGKDGDTCYEVNDGNDIWTVYEVTPVEEEEAAEEPDEVPPTVDKKKSAKKKSAGKKPPSKPKSKPKEKASSKIRKNLSNKKKKKKGAK